MPRVEGLGDHVVVVASVVVDLCRNLLRLGWCERRRVESGYVRRSNSRECRCGLPKIVEFGAGGEYLQEPILCMRVWLMWVGVCR